MAANRYRARMEQWDAEFRKAFGMRLKEARNAKGMTLVDVGAMFDTGKQTVGHWETGKNMPSAEQVARLADEYGASVEWLLMARHPLRFSPELSARLASQGEEEFRRLENSLRATFDLPPLPKKTDSGKRLPLAA